jgi:hypothetical protein
MFNWKILAIDTAAKNNSVPRYIDFGLKKLCNYETAKAVRDN